MFNLKKYALAAALVVPSVIGFTAKDADAAKVVIDKELANAVNVRSQAQMGDNILGLISDVEKEYDIKNNEGDWIHINFDGKDAYVDSVGMKEGPANNNPGKKHKGIEDP